MKKLFAAFGVVILAAMLVGAQDIQRSRTSGQIAFPPGQIASTDANTLDDYEEGSWTPAWQGTGGQSGQVYSAQVGRYVKIGKFVYLQGTITLSTLGTITTNAQIAGLPFTSENTTLLDGGININYWAALTTASVYMSGVIAPNTTAIDVYFSAAAAVGLGALAQANMSATTDLRFSGWYRATN